MGVGVGLVGRRALFLFTIVSDEFEGFTPALLDAGHHRVLRRCRPLLEQAVRELLDYAAVRGYGQDLGAVHGGSVIEGQERRHFYSFLCGGLYSIGTEIAQSVGVFFATGAAPPPPPPPIRSLSHSYASREGSFHHSRLLFALESKVIRKRS